MIAHFHDNHNVDNNFQKLKYLIEQAEEVATDDPFFTLFGRLRRRRTPSDISGNSTA